MRWPDLKTAIANDLLPGLRPNRASRPDGAWKDQTDPTYDLLFVEFDDQGRPFEPNAIDRAMSHLETVTGESDPVVILFVHGWKHSAQDDDDNVRSVHRLLHTAAHTEQLSTAVGRSRRVVGVYVGWRGLSLHWLNLVQNLTFWGRKEAALRVALGSVRELFARLRSFRLAGQGDEGTGRRLIIVGHSFGGLIVHAAIAEYLIESVAAPTTHLDPIAPFGDLTILVNPAFEASKYYPLHSIVARRSFAPRQAPVFVSITASNDWATGMAFPLGRHLSLYTGPSIGPREHAANFDTMGHVLWMQTHDLSLAVDAKPDAPTKLIEKRQLSDDDRKTKLDEEDAAYRTFLAQETDAAGHLLPGWSRRYSSGAVLREMRPPPEADEPGPSPDNPFWVVRASPEIVDGHNGIFRFVFLDFLRQVLDDTIRASTTDKVR